MRAKFTLIAAVSLVGCGTPDSQIAKHSTGVLERRLAELTQRIKDDELGVYVASKACGRCCKCTNNITSWTMNTSRACANA